MQDHHKLLLGIILLLIALSLITAGCGVAWGTAGALIGGGIICAIYGFVAFAQIKG